MQLLLLLLLLTIPKEVLTPPTIAPWQVGLMASLPLLFEALSMSYERAKSHSEVQASVLRRFYFFQLIQVGDVGWETWGGHCGVGRFTSLRER